MKKISKLLLISTACLLCVTSVFPINANASDYAKESSHDNEKLYSDFKTSGEIWIAGDSIAADHSYENEDDYAEFVHGWGEVIGNYLTNEAKVNNLAISGKAAKDFTEEDNYRQIMEGIGKGDFLIISFGHNDYKSGGSDHSTLPSSVEGSYKWYLKNYYIDPALKAGAMPVLCTSVVLCDFSDGHVVENQNQAVFAQAMRELYLEYEEAGIEIGFIDTYMLTQSVLNVYKSSASSFYALKYDKKTDENGNKTTSLDHVHFSYKGADMAANMIAQNLFVLYKDFNRFNKNDKMEGEGTEASPYLVSDSAQFFRIMQDDNLNSEDKYYGLSQNIDCVIDDKQWEKNFYANLNGNGFTITNPVNRSLESFIDKNYGVIENVNLKFGLHHTNTYVQYPFVKENYGEIRNCSAGGSIYTDSFLVNAASYNFGVFSGINRENAVIENCNNSVSVTLNSDISFVAAGGIAGANYGKIEKCNNTGYILVDLTEYYDDNEDEPEKTVCAAGGIAGLNYENGIVTECNSDKMGQARSELSSKNSYILSDYIAPDAAAIIDDINSDGNNGENNSNNSNNSNNGSNSDNEGNNISDNKSDDSKAEVKKGDADLNGKVDLSDAKLALKYALGIKDASGNNLKAADLNDDNKVTLNEVKSILKYALGINKTLI